MKYMTKKLVAVALSLAMVVSSIAFYNAEVKADPIELTINVALEQTNQHQLRVTWTNPSDVDANPNDYHYGYYVNSIGQNNQCQAANGYCWGDAHRSELDTVAGTNGGLYFDDGGDFVIIVVITKNGETYAQGQSISVHMDPDTNTDAQFKLDRYEQGGAITVCSWQEIGGAHSYIIKNKDTNVTLATVNSGAAYWTQWTTPTSDTPGDTYTCQFLAYDANGNLISITNNEITLNYYNSGHNYNAKFKLDRYEQNGKITVCSWTLIYGADSYKLFNDDTGDLLGSAGSSGTYTYWNTQATCVQNSTYTAKLVAYDSNGDEIEITNDTLTLDYYYVTVPSEHTSADYSSATWDSLPLTGSQSSSIDTDYYINSDNNLNKFFWGIYAPNQEIPYHAERTHCRINGAAFSCQESNVKYVWVNSYLYLNPSDVFNNQGDCTELSISVFRPGINVVTLEKQDGSMKTFGIKVEGGTTHSITIDNTKVADVFDGTTYMLPSTGMTQYSEYGYYLTSDNTKVYAPGDGITVNSDLTFTGIDTLSLTHTNGATIHMVKDEPGIAFKATASMNNGVPVFNNSFTYGTIVTTQDLFIDAYSENLVLDNTRNQVHVNLTSSSQWADGAYTVGVLNIKQDSFTRNFVSRAYCTINYTTGHSKTFYATNPTDSTNRARNVSQVARSMKAATSYYNSLQESEKEAVDYFATFQ